MDVWVKATIGGVEKELHYQRLLRGGGRWNQPLLQELSQAKALLHCMCTGLPIPMHIRKDGRKSGYCLVTNKVRPINHARQCPRYFETLAKAYRSVGSNKPPQAQKWPSDALGARGRVLVPESRADAGDEASIRRSWFVPSLEQLNVKQREAATHVDGPALVVAAAGSGKTATLITRIRYLVEKGVDPRKILACTFTSLATEEMKERIYKELGPEQGKKVTVSTLHSVAFKMVMHILGDAWKVLTDPTSTIEHILEPSSNYNPRGLGPVMPVKDAVQGIGIAKAEAKTVEQVPGVLGKVYAEYEENKKRRKLLDFEDMILEAVRLFREDRDFAQYWHNRWEYVLVDEFQDTNITQWLFVKELVRKTGNLMAIGDDKQSIYRWRAAKPELMKSFVNEFPSAKVIHLTLNYRSHDLIVQLSNKVIDLNKGHHIETTVEAFREDAPGAIVRAVTLKTDVEEARWVAEEILRLRNRFPSIPFSEYAILYRTNIQSRVYEEALAERDIPYQILGDSHFYESRDVQVILGFLRTAQDTSDSSVWVPILNKPNRFISRAVIKEVSDGGWDVLRRHEKCQSFVKVIDQVQKRTNPGEAIEWLVKSQQGLVKMQEEDEPVRWVESLISSAKRYNTTAEFLRFVDWVVEKSKEPQSDATQLLTLHRSKGLEYTTVFLAGMVEGLLPHQKSIEDDDVLEETRLAYVGLTRSKQNLYLMAAEIYGDKKLEMSRYIRILQ